MSLSINTFKSKLTGGGARPNLFKCTITNPRVIAGVDSELASFMCKGASLPGSTVGEITVPFRGRQVKVAGDRTFENWTATIINDTNFVLRDAFERWMNSINAHARGTALSSNPADYQAQIVVEQLNRQNQIIKSYVIEGAFPINVAPIDLSFESNDSIEEFTVDFAYQFWFSNTTS